MGRRGKRALSPGRAARVRRRTSMFVERLVAMPWKRFGPAHTSVAVDGDRRLALITINFATTRYLRLMLHS